MYINEQVKLEINHKKQYVSIRSQKENAPLLLYLHGGPGDAALPLFLKYNSDLERYYTVVVLEQRGAGKSYYKFEKHDNITINTFVEDIYTLTQYLLNRFQQQKIYLIGHSWGSVLGLTFIKKYPELVQTYVGCGQVVNMKKSCQIAYEYAWSKADKKTRKKLAQIDCTYTKESWLQDLLFVTRQVVKYKGSLYGKSSYNKLVIPFLCSKYYTPLDLVKRQKGSLQSIMFLWQELMQTNFENHVQYDVPIIFVEGRHDMHVSSKLVKEYYDSILSTKEFIWFENSCHFPQWSESNKFNQMMIDLVNR